MIGFRERRILSMPLEETDGLQPGDHIVARSEDSRVAVGTALLGRVLDGFGQPMDSGPAIATETSYDLYRPAPSPLDREHITEPLVTGIRAIDSMLPCGKGQRVGLFGGSGVGKSTLLGAICKHNTADVTVIALIGERNREVRAFLERELGQEGMKRAVTVVATSDRPAPLRVRAAFVALAIAEYFRDRGANVLLMMDSVTRLAMAQREIGLAAGNLPVKKVIPRLYSTCCRRYLNARAIFRQVPSPASSRFWLKVMTSMNRSATPSAGFSMDISFFRDSLARPATIRRLIS